MGDCFNSYNRQYANNSIGSRKGKNKHQSMDDKRTGTKKYQSEIYGYPKNNIGKYDYSGSSKICGIINLGNNCYLNSGLQILASCRELVSELNKTNSTQRIIPYIKDAINSLLTQKIYNPTKFMDYFCSKNSDFIRGSQCCSQNFIRTLIRNMNSDSLESVSKNYNYNPSGKEKSEYDRFIISNRIFPESKIQSIFSGITKSFSTGRCKNCKKTIDNYSFSYFIDLNLYLDEIDYKCDFSDVLNSNIGGANNLSMDCPYCGYDLNLKEYTKFIKLPDVLIFTLERYQGVTNNVEIKPNPNISLLNYVDNSLRVDCAEYELFAINIRYGRSANFGHEICQVKRDGVWYEINDRDGQRISYTSHYDCSYGLFYRKTKNNTNNLYSSFNKVNYYMEEDDDDDNYENEIKTETKKLEDKKQTNESSCFGGISNIFSSDNKAPKLIRIINYNHTYINSGIEIISLFDELVNYLKKYEITDLKNQYVIDLIKDAIAKISNNKEFDAYNLTQIKFEKPIKSSQDFIINVIKRIDDEFLKFNKHLNDSNLEYIPKASNTNENNEFNKLLKNLKYESKPKSIFSFIIKYHTKANCYHCYEQVDNYSFLHDIEFKIKFNDKFKYLYTFSELLEDNIKIKSMTCPRKSCKKVISAEIGLKFIKLPEIFIFTLERDKGTGYKSEIKPDETIDMKKYIDPSLKENYTRYELFAINMRNKDNDECQIKKNGKWYQLNEGYYKDISFQTFNNEICGLFYRRVKNSY